MFTIIKRRELNPTVTELCIHAPLIAKKAKAGQFIIVRAKEDSERIPLTKMCIRDRCRGSARPTAPVRCLRCLWRWRGWPCMSLSLIHI